MGTVSRVHTFASGAVLTAAQLNNEFDTLLTSSAFNGGLDATNLGVTAGQITASKAIVVDGSRNLDDGTTSNQINNLVLSGTLTVAGATTQTGALSIDDTTNSTSTTTGSIHTDGGMGIALDLIVGDDVKLLTDSAVLSLGVGSDATLTHDGTTGLTIAANPVIVDSGDALTLDAHTGIFIFKDAGSEVLRFTEGSSGDVTIKLATNGKDLIFTDNGDATGLKVLDAAAGINVPGEVQTTKIAYTDGDDAITIADGGGVTTSGTFESGGAATLASLVCTAAGTFGGGYGATGATISTAGVIQANGAITSDGAVTGATLAGTVSTAAQNSITSASSLATVGTITSGTWQGTKVASAYLDDQTAHLNITQSFTGAKTFGAATQFNSTVTVGVDDTGYDVQLFGATSGSNILWDQSADDLIFTNAGIAVGSDATGDIYYRNSSGFLARLGASTDGHVLTTGGAGTIPAWEALPGGGTFSGPGSSTDNAVVRFNGTGGATGQNSGVIIDDSNNVTGAGNVTLSGELDAATGDFSGDVNVAGEVQTANIGYTDGDNAMTIADGGGVTFPQAATFTSGFSNNDQDITNVGNIALDSISSDAGTSIAITLGTDAGDDLLVGTDKLVVEGDSGKVGIGTTAPDGPLHIMSASAGTVTADSNADELVIEGSGNTGITILSGSSHQGNIVFGDGDNNNLGQFGYHQGNEHFTWGKDTAQQMVLDASGNLILGGTTTTTNWTASGKLFIEGAIPGVGLRDTTGSADDWMLVNSNGTLTIANDTDNTQPLTVTDAGRVLMSSAGGDGVEVLVYTNSGGTNPNGLRLHFSGVSSGDATDHFVNCTDAGGTRCEIRSNGDLANANNSYGSSSDLKIKQDITDGRSYWGDFKNLQYKKYRLKQAVEVDVNAPHQLGLIAQDVETIWPSVVDEIPDKEWRTVAVLDAEGNATYESDLDADGNHVAVTEDVHVDLGTTTKSLKYSIIHGPIMGSVVQELQTRLEAAEAKIAALESA